MIKEYDDLIRYINQLEEKTDTFFDFEEPLIDENGHIHLKVIPNLRHCNENYQDYDMDFSDTHFNGEFLVQNALKHQSQVDGMPITFHISNTPELPLYKSYLSDKRQHEIDSQKEELSNNSSYKTV